jgi:hypothetical protein
MPLQENAMALKINNPYNGAAKRWLRGEIHAHVNKARGGTHGYKDGVDASTLYSAACDAGLDFICMSVDVTAKKGGANLFGHVGSGDACGVTGIPAREIQNDRYKNYFNESGAEYLHVLTIGEVDGISLCAHPLYFEVANCKSEGGWQQIKSALLAPEPDGCLDRLKVAGLEIYNGFTQSRLDHDKKHEYADYDERCWDQMLKRGRRYWGFAGNDAFFHHRDHFSSFCPVGVVYVAVEDGRAEADIITAMKEGRFYSSTGVRLADVPIVARVDGETLRIEVSAKDNVNWHAKICDVDNQITPQSAPNRRHASFPIPGKWKYVRIQAHCIDHPGRRAWLQPITNEEFF